MNRRIAAAIPFAMAIALVASSPRIAAAQSKAAEATAARLSTPSGRADFVRAVLGNSEMAEASAESIKDGRFVAQLATAVTTGASGLPGATSIATLSNINILSGLVTARGVIAMATTHSSGASAAGSGFEGLAIRGIVIPGGDNVAPNTRIMLPGVGYVVLNEQVVEGGALRVTMIHLVVEGTPLASKREFYIASASSSP